jgi:hypothetical protein
MWKILALVACLLLVAAAVAGAFAATHLSNLRFRRISRRTTPTVCISCQGKGWTTERHRTLAFDGDSFIDRDVRSHQCAACGGTGVVYR